MKPYKKEDVEHVLEEFKTRLEGVSKEVGGCMFVDSRCASEAGEYAIGVVKLEGLLEKGEKDWTFDDYMSFYKVKEYLV